MRAAPRPRDRPSLLKQRRWSKMACSAHAYVRGNTARFYDWLEESSQDAIPAGPPVWICGDCHVGNLGPVVGADGRIQVVIRDLDQAVIGNPAHDLIRLGLSLASACRSANLPGAVSVKVVDALLDGYARAFTRRPHHKDAPETIKALLREAIGRSWKQLVREHLTHTQPHIPLGKRFWPLSKAERRAIAALLSPDALGPLAVGLGIARPDDAVRMADAAYWVKGCSSLGRPRYAVLLEIDEAGGHTRLAMLDIKDAPPAAAPRTTSSAMPRDNAERVVAAAMALSPALGERMVAVRLLDRPMVLRELAPHDLKIEPDHMPPAAIDEIGAYLGRIVGDAHARQMSAAQRKAWHGILRASRSSQVDAPSWLWQAIVDALASHERGYLQHCRRHIALIG
ncbi:DUF2252 family protein [Zoogloea oryzae]|nr:DUF2252 family protein [Zoogloea oryzae]